MVLTTIVGVNGYQMIVGDGYSSKPAWRDAAALGALVVDQVNETNLMPTLNAFWLLFGWQRPIGRAI